ncbi:MAG: hypothetical protein JO301_00715 [Chitinophagaceae bacterium]|nr:hypothetical protein [Chitinophagaceae bacterium]
MHENTKPSGSFGFPRKYFLTQARLCVPLLAVRRIIARIQDGFNTAGIAVLT